MGDWSEQLLGAGHAGVMCSLNALETLADVILATGGGGNSTFFPIGANAGVFYQGTLARGGTLTEMGWLNGSGIGGNIDCGVYDMNGNKLVSTGSVAQSGGSAIQVASVSSTPLAPGNYVLGLSVSSQQIWNPYTPDAILGNACGAKQIGSMFTLPSTVDFGTGAATAFVIPILAIMASAF